MHIIIVILKMPLYEQNLSFEQQIMIKAFYPTLISME